VNETHTNFNRAGGTRSCDKDLIDLILFGMDSQFISVQQQHIIKPFTSVLDLGTVVFSIKNLNSDTSAPRANTAEGTE
jgi:hypothetical protein